MKISTPPTLPKALTIAGSDSGGGAGIQADLKTFAALGVYGASVITAVTAQNTLHVSTFKDVPAEVVLAQIDAVMSDIGAQGVKSGMLSTAPIIEAVATGLLEHRVDRYVLDPVMVAKSGDRLLKAEATESLRAQLLPLALIVTPNVPEAEVLTGRSGETEDDLCDMARALYDMGPRWVLLKGGHREGDAVDILYDGTSFELFTSIRYNTRNTHGTGCSLSAAIAAGLAQGREAPEAVLRAKQFVSLGIRESRTIGAGHSPIHHFFAQDAEALRRLDERLAEAGVTRRPR